MSALGGRIVVENDGDKCKPFIAQCRPHHAPLANITAEPRSAGCRPALAPAPWLPPSPYPSPVASRHPARISSVKAECAWLAVPEDRAKPQGRQIQLRIARIPAAGSRKQPDPLTVLAGGPGMAASVMYTSTVAAFARINQDRDILLVDQRGTGESAPLNCHFDEEDTYNADDDAPAGAGARLS